jgi:hypothetical protein
MFRKIPINSEIINSAEREDKDERKRGLRRKRRRGGRETEGNVKVGTHL